MPRLGRPPRRRPRCPLRRPRRTPDAREAPLRRPSRRPPAAPAQTTPLQTSLRPQGVPIPISVHAPALVILASNPSRFSFRARRVAAASPLERSTISLPAALHVLQLYRVERLRDASRDALQRDAPDAMPFQASKGANCSSSPGGTPFFPQTSKLDLSPYRPCIAMRTREYRSHSLMLPAGPKSRSPGVSRCRQIDAPASRRGFTLSGAPSKAASYETAVLTSCLQSEGNSRFDQTSCSL